MNYYHDLEDNQRSWFSVLQEALPDIGRVQNALHLLQRYCQHHKIFLQIDAGHNFMAVGQNNQETTAVCSSLYYSDLGAECTELAAFLNGKIDLDAAALAVKIIEIAPRYSTAERDKIDRILRQQVMLASPKPHFDMALFFPQHYITDTKMLLITAATQAQEVEYTHTIPIDLWRTILAYQLHNTLEWPVAQTFSRYYIAELHHLQDAQGSWRQILEILSGIAWVRKHNQPAFLITSGDCNNAVLALIPEGEEVLSYLMTIGEHDTLIQLIKKLHADLFVLPGIKDVLHQCRPLTFLPSNNTPLDIISAIAAFVEASNNQEFKASRLRQLYVTNLSSHGLNPSFSKCAQQAIKALSPIPFTSKEPKKPECLPLPDSRQKTAYAIFTALQRYSPAFYDIFGYDISHRRYHLLQHLLHTTELAQYGHIYHHNLTQLLRARKRGAIYQDLLLGIFIDEVADDAEVSRAHVLENLHPTLAKIATASEHAYLEHRQKQGLRNIHSLMGVVHLDLVSNLHALLCKCDEAELVDQLAQAINVWLNTEHQVALVLADSTQTHAFEDELLHIIEELCETLQPYGANVLYKNSRHAEKIQIALGNTKVVNLGEFAGLVCYQRAHLEAMSKQQDKNEHLLFPLYQRYLSALPKVIRASHIKHVEHKKAQVQARRVVKVLQYYKPFALRREYTCKSMCDRLLTLMTDGTIYELFAPHFNKIVHQEVKPDSSIYYSWNWPAERLLHRPEFIEFMRYVLQVAKIKPENSKLHPKLLSGLKRMGNS